MNTTEEKRASFMRKVETTPQLSLLYSGEKVILPQQLYVLPSGGTVIGREVPKGGIQLDTDKRVSRRHASFHVGVLGNTVLLRNEASRNGTFVNGRQITEAQLRDGDLINVGDSFLVFRLVAKSGSGLSAAPIDGLIGSAPCVCALRSMLRRIAPTETTVLVLGETGTGKEVVANSLHRLSGRPGKLTAVNCSTIPESLAESLLFGHQQGSYTDAKGSSPGFFRAAHKGTIFLDEIGEMPLHLQPKLLRVLEERTVIPVGSHVPLAVDVRVIAATNRNLALAVQTGRFRPDLYARLAEYQVNLPPLQERREDILQLLVHALNLPQARFTPELIERLLLYHWPFNVREVFKVAAQLRINGMGAPWLEMEMLEGRLDQASGMKKPASPLEDEATEDEASETSEDLGAPDREELCKLLRQHQGVVSNLARAVNRSRKQVYRWLHKHNVEPADFRSGQSSTVP